VIKRADVEIITGNTVEKVTSYLPGEVSGVTLKDGTRIPCEMVVVAIGVRPRLDLVSGTGVTTNRGIVVDRTMMTSVPDVYACGDVAEAYDFVNGENRVIPIWPAAYTGGRVAGSNMAGVRTEYKGGTAMNSMKYFGVSIVSAGLSALGGDDHEVISYKRDGVYKKLVLKDGLVAGMLFSGDIEKSGIIYNLMKDGTNVESFKRALLEDDFGLSSLPEEIWKSKLAIASSLPAATASPDRNKTGH
jgi:NAD(P)H-nitrite reductase large subunit